MSVKLLRLGELSLSNASYDSVWNLVAVKSSNFLCHVSLAGNVHSVPWRNYLAVLYLKAKPCEIFNHVALWYFSTKELIYPLRVKINRLRCLVLVILINVSLYDLASTKLFNKLESSHKSLVALMWVKTLFISCRSVSSHAKLLGCSSYARTVKASRLKYNSSCIVHDAAVFAAHNACNSNRLVVVADGEHLVAQVVIHAVQSLDGLTVAGTADNNAAIGQALVVERMHRLAVLEHNIVGDINDVVDRTNAAGVQTLAHPRRSRLDLDILDNAGGVARAQVGVLDLDGHILVDVVANALDLRGLDAERTVEGSRSLAGQTDHAQAVRAVGRDLKIGNPVVQTKHLLDVLANRSAGRQEKDAVFARIRYAAVGQTQLLERAHHAVGRHAAQLALGDLHAARQGGLVQADRADLANGRRRYIGCAGDDLHRLLLADIELADLQMVGIRVIDNLEDLAGHNIVDLRTEVVTLLDLGARHSQLGIILLRGDAVHIGIIRKPG